MEGWRVLHSKQRSVSGEGAWESQVHACLWAGAGWFCCNVGAQGVKTGGSMCRPVWGGGVCVWVISSYRYTGMYPALRYLSADTLDIA